MCKTGLWHIIYTKSIICHICCQRIRKDTVKSAPGGAEQGLREMGYMSRVLRDD